MSAHRAEIEIRLSLLDGAVGVYSDSALIDANGDKSRLYAVPVTQCSQRISDISRTVPLFFQNCVSGDTPCIFIVRCWMVFPSAMILFSIINWRWRHPVFGGLSFCTEPLVYHRVHGGNHTNAGLAGKSARKQAIVRTATRSGKPIAFSSDSAFNIYWIACRKPAKH